MTQAPTLRRFLRLPEVVEAVGKCRSWVYEAAKKGEFPRPIKLGPSTVVWDAEEVAKWQEARIRERDEALAKM